MASETVGLMEKMKKSEQKPGPVKRTVNKLKHPKEHLSKSTNDSSDHDQQEGSSGSGSDFEGYNAKHVATAEYAGSVGHALVRELFRYLQGSEGEAALKNVLVTQAKVAAEFSVSDPAKSASRIAAQEITKGSYDAMEQKVKNEWENALPKHVTFSLVSALIGAFASMLALGLLLALWRFAIFGLS